jgi:hypothetical protein
VCHCVSFGMQRNYIVCPELHLSLYPAYFCGVAGESAVFQRMVSTGRDRHDVDFKM